VKPTTRFATVTGDLGGQKIDMGIDKSAIQHIMSVLTDLYSDPAAAVVREYATNAIDSHIEAGYTGPVLVTMPTPLSSYLVIEDFGLGLSVDEINRIYSQYGASTKRDSNDVAGMLGLGCKSGLTYAAQFTVIGVKDGVKTTVVVSRRENGTGVMEVVDTCSTDDRNGVKISIPVSGVNKMRETVENFFQFWKPGTVLIDGKPPTNSMYEDKDFLQISDKMWVRRTDSYHDTDYVIMGNVTYPVPSGVLFANNSYRYFFVYANVDMASVDITPSREALMMTSKTKATLRQIEQEFAANVISVAQADIDKANTGAEARKAWLLWKPIVSNWRSKLMWRGTVVPDAVLTYSLGTLIDAFSVRVRGWNGTGGTNYNPATTMLVYGYPERDSVSSEHRRKMRHYAAENLGLSHNWEDSIAVFTDKPVSEWVDDLSAVHWDDIKNIKIDPAASNRTSIAGTRKVFSSWVTGRYGKSAYYSRRVPANDLVNANLLYLSDEELLATHPRIEQIAGYTIVVVHDSHLKKFLADFPNAVSYFTARKQVADKYDHLLTDDDKFIMDHADYYLDQVCRKLNNHKIDDPDIVAVISKMINGRAEADKRIKTYKDHLQEWGFASKAWDTQNPFDKYPLVSYHTLVTDLEGIVLYMNAKYANREEA
jgi:hypothetical protein